MTFKKNCLIIILTILYIRELCLVLTPTKVQEGIWDVIIDRQTVRQTESPRRESALRSGLLWSLPLPNSITKECCSGRQPGCRHRDPIQRTSGQTIWKMWKGGIWRCKDTARVWIQSLNTPHSAIIRPTNQSPEFLFTFPVFLSLSLFLLSAFLSFCCGLWSCLSEMRIPNFLSELTSVPGALSLPLCLVSPFNSQRRIQSVLLMAYMCFD